MERKMFFHPKYYKRVRIGLFQRIMTAITVTFTAVWRGLGFILSAPISGLNAFCVYERSELDIEQIAEDEKKNPSSTSESGDYFGGSKPDNREDWKKEHDEEYGE
jgi:hypothetical protein